MTTRREFLSGKPIFEAGQGAEVAEQPLVALGDTVRLGTPAMASDFEVVLNPGPASRLEAASNALELVAQLEDQMSVYRAHTELSQLNARAADGPVQVEKQLFVLLQRAVAVSVETEGAFDPTAGSLVALWRQCKRDKRLPTEVEIAAARAVIGCRHVIFDEEAGTIRYDRAGVTLNLNAMGKGYALDRAADVLNPAGADWLMHGGYSSILARGAHASCDGWPVAIRHPLFPNRQLATVLLKDRGVSTSGSAVQFFRYQGKRYGHIVDPRSGWPVDAMLSATVLAPDAALAEALSTAFFVLGVEKAREYCHNHEEVAALLVPTPAGGNRLEPVACGIPDSDVAFVPQ
ncbi:MAG: FAD:protein FMN transferase [Planctomycetia bacterium]|nr:FAD:protein FMN transferase [Planctomycetia bacterium]